MPGSGGVSGLMFVLRATAERAERGEGPSLDQLYAPADLREARRRLLVGWTLSMAWIAGLIVPWLTVFAVPVCLIGVVVAIGTLVEPTLCGSLIRPWVVAVIPVALLGSGVVLAVQV